MDLADVSAIATLDDDVRRALFTCVRDAPGPVTREAAAEAVGISRKLAAFHLDKLVAAGLLTARIEAVGPRRVGRAPKVYVPSGRAVEVSVPQREHALLADILVTAAQGQRPGESASEAIARVARERGEQAGSEIREQVRPGRLGVERARRLVAEQLVRQGFEPADAGERTYLRNCPFHPLAQTSPEIVCSLNHAYLSGLLAGMGADGVLDAVLAAAPGRCCVAFDPQRPAGQPPSPCRPAGRTVAGTATPRWQDGSRDSDAPVAGR